MLGRSTRRRLRWRKFTDYLSHSMADCGSAPERQGLPAAQEISLGLDTALSGVAHRRPPTRQCIGGYQQGKMMPGEEYGVQKGVDRGRERRIGPQCSLPFSLNWYLVSLFLISSSAPFIFLLLFLPPLYSKITRNLGNVKCIFYIPII